MESKALIDLCRQAGIELRNQLSSVDADVRDQIVALVKRGSAQAATPARSPVPVLDPRERVRDLGPTRPRPVRPATEATPTPVPTPTVPAEVPAVVPVPE